MTSEHFTADQARHVADSIGIQWETACFDPGQFRMGMDVELEHGKHDLQTNVTGGDPLVTGKIAWAHLRESWAAGTSIFHSKNEHEEVYDKGEG